MSRRGTEIQVISLQMFVETRKSHTLGFFWMKIYKVWGGCSGPPPGIWTFLYMYWFQPNKWCPCKGLAPPWKGRPPPGKFSGDTHDVDYDLVFPSVNGLFSIIKLIMGVTRKFSRGGPPFPGGGQTLARTSFIRLKPIHIKESSDSRGGPEHPPAPPSWHPWS